MKQELNSKFDKRNSQVSYIFFLTSVLYLFFGSIQHLKAQTFVQVPATGGVTSPNFLPGGYGPFSNLNVRAAMLYSSSELNHIPTNLTFNSIGFKIVGTITSSNIQGLLSLYVIPTTDSIYSLNSSWNTIMQEPNLKLVHRRGYFFHMPSNGAFNFILDSTFTISPNHGFYFVYEWESAGMVNYDPPLECNTTVTNGYHVGLNNSHWNWVAPTHLNLSNNYRHVLHLGHATGITGIKDSFPDNDVKVYPNPAQELLKIDFRKLANGSVQTTLRDLTGKIVKAEILKNKENQILLTGIAPGIYSLHLTSGTETLVKRIVIE